MGIEEFEDVPLSWCPDLHSVHAKRSMQDKLQNFIKCFGDSNQDASPACNSLQMILI
jgi:hypothetical protein